MSKYDELFSTLRAGETVSIPVDGHNLSTIRTQLSRLNASAKGIAKELGLPYADKKMDISFATVDGVGCWVLKLVDSKQKPNPLNFTIMQRGE